jgi:hypothetical protein
VTSPLRPRVERWSLPMLARLRLAPRWLVFVVVLGLVLGGVFLHPPLASLPLVVVGGLMAWLTYLAWPALPPNGRVSRALVVLLVLGFAVQRAVSG